MKDHPDYKYRPRRKPKGYRGVSAGVSVTNHQGNMASKMGSYQHPAANLSNFNGGFFKGV
jgi:hypothetical protein